MSGVSRNLLGWRCTNSPLRLLYVFITVFCRFVAGSSIMYAVVEDSSDEEQHECEKIYINSGKLYRDNLHSLNKYCENITKKQEGDVVLDDEDVNLPFLSRETKSRNVGSRRHIKIQEPELLTRRGCPKRGIVVGCGNKETVISSIGNSTLLTGKVQESCSGRNLRSSSRKRAAPVEPQVPSQTETKHSETNTDDCLIISSDSEDDVAVLSEDKILNEDDIAVNEDDDDDDENCELTIKVYWRYKDLKKFTVRKYQKLTVLFEFFANLENISQDQLLFMMRDSIPLHPSHTPASLGLTEGDIIEGGITVAQQRDTNLPPAKPESDADTLEIKVQRSGFKEPTVLYIRKSQRMQVLMAMCAEELQLSLDKMKFEFDGEPLDPKATAEDLDLEGGECIDLKVVV